MYFFKWEDFYCEEKDCFYDFGYGNDSGRPCRVRE